MEEARYSAGDLMRAVEKWRGQNRKGFLELCILRCVRSTRRIYGFALMDYLAQRGLELSEGSLYPLLSRLVKEKTLAAEWETPDEGHPRKYYALTMHGLDFLHKIEELYEEDWSLYARIGEEGGSNE